MRLWQTISLVENGLGGGNEILGGVWAVLIAFALWQGPQMPRALGGLCVVIGVCGFLTVIPQIGDLPGAVFGLGYIVLFVWIGALLLKRA